MGKFKSTALVAALAAAGLPDATMANEKFMLEEIVVTAQKRSQNTQDIGLAIAAVSGEALREQGVNNAADLTKVVPNMSVQNVSGGGVPVVIIRGVGLQNFRINDSPTTSFYIDDVYQTSIASAEFSMYDLERVEVLKGPQGGLYGRNTIAGAVQIISNTPDAGEPFNAYVDAEYGKYNTKEVEGGVTLPLSDIAAARFSGRWVKSDDTYFESVPGDFKHGEADRWGLRSVVRITPNDTMDFVWKVHGGEDQSELPLLRAMGIYGLAAGANTPFTGAFGFGLCDSVTSGQGIDPSSCYAMNGQTPDELYQASSDRYNSGSTMKPYLDNSWWGTSLKATFELGDYTLTSISAYDRIDYGRVTDVDSNPLEQQEIDYSTDITSWSQEFRLASEGDNYSWVAGVNYAEDTLDENTVMYSGDLLSVLFAPAPVNTAVQPYTQEAQAFAVYAHAEWQFIENFNLVGELRYTDETRSFEGSSSVVDSSTGMAYVTVGTDDETSFDAVSGKLALEWFATDNVLAYASYSRGFKTGGYFGGLVTSEEQLAPYDSEFVDAYELGIKSDWLDGTLRVNGSVFYYDRQDVQASARKQTGPVTVARLQNVGDVETEGAELDVTWLPLDGLTLNLGVGYTNATLVDSDLVSGNALDNFGLNGGQFYSLEGANMPNYSNWSSNFTGKYEFSVTDQLMASVQLEYSYRSERDGTMMVDRAVEEGVFEMDSYDLINLRLGLGSEDGLWKASVFVENLADEEYKLLSRGDGLGGAHELYGAPRIWGVSFTRNWD